MMFKPVKPKVDFVKLEEGVLSFWKEKDVFKKQLELRAKSKKFIFLEGPPTANGKPHMGHVLTRTIKDTVCRYKAMAGYYVPRKAGWDCHGLPVEIEVEKKLGITRKKEIESYGIDKFNKMCKESVFTYEKAWKEMTDRLGFWLDMENPYITMDNDYIESVWWSLKELFNKGKLYQGYKVVWYCPRCGTPLSSHEVAQGYKKTKDPSVFVKFPVENEENTYLLAWTTTPWTLLSNVALAVHPDYDYVLVSHEGEQLILAETLASSVLGNDYKVLKKFKGKELKGKKYKPLFSYTKPDKPAYYVITAEFVTLEDGTGIVHIAPAFGEEDYEVSLEYNLPVVQLVNEEGKIKDEVTDFKGLFFKDADKLIMKDLEERGLLYKVGTYEHDYPFCWRCDTPLMSYAWKTWYIRMSELKDLLLENNEKINWQPPHIKHGRFGNFLENISDWALSRNRYWGTPLPIWVCEKCGHKLAVGSKKELEELSMTKTKLEDLHKPYIDEIKIKCPKCGGTMSRVPEVIDVWYDSGSAPFAQFHYPFENKELFESSHPVDFISEAVDQTRGWFYSLHAISTALFGTEAYKNVVVLGLVLDEKGQKMSKSKGNVVDPWELFSSDGADSLRWYLTTNSAPWDPKRFFKKAVREIRNQFLNTLWNAYSFFVTYANIDKINPLDHNLPVKERENLDKWLISQLNSVVKDVRASLDAYQLHKAARVIEDFVVTDLSNWYIRRSRRRFWEEGMSKSKIAAYLTLYEALVTVIKLTAPFIPFTPEAIYQNLVRSVDPNAPISVHLADYPTYDESLIDKELEEQMNLVIKIVEAGRAARASAKIKARQPLRKVYVKLSPENAELIKRYLQVIKDELNIKEVVFLDNINDFVSYNIHLNFKTLGRKYKKLVKDIQKQVHMMDPSDLFNKLETGNKITIEVGETKEKVTLTLEDISISKSGKDNFAFATRGDIEVVLDTTLDDELYLEGLARDLIRRIQDMRKTMDLQYTQKIKKYYDGTPSVKKVFEVFSSLIKEETQASEVKEGKAKDGYTKEWVIGKEKATLGVEPM